MESTSFTPPSIEVLNQLLPAYHFYDLIAQGGMGAVYLAKQVSLDREVAVKILPRELSADPEFRTSFKTEARAMAKLNHPNLIGIYDSGDVDGLLFIAMEYVPGKSLYHSSWNKKIDPAEASRIIVAICAGLSHAHENGIIHRDIKPANILLTPKIEPKIGDFGLAQSVGVKHKGVVMGTPGYSAPEVISHPEKADRRSDIFAVGVMLHELMTGQKPQPGVTASSLCKCNPEYDAIILRATHPNPLMRYPDAKSLATAILELSNPKNAPKSGMVLAKNNPAARNTGSVNAQVLGGAMIKKPGALSVAGAAPVAGVLPRKASSDDDDDDVVLPPIVIKSGNAGWGYVRNLLIIAGLCVVVVFVYQKLQIHKQEVAKKEQEYLVKQKEEEMRMRREAEQEAARLLKESLNKPSHITRPTSDPIEPKKETAMESLERLKYDLSKGSRVEMPIGTKRRGELDFFLVTEAMTWDEALFFAEQHGGHIALPSSEDDIPFLTALLSNNETVWIGAGRSGRDQWVLIDGSKWTLEKNPPGNGSIATLSHLGNVRAAEPSRELPFVIAWHRDGSNPSSLANLLQVSRKSLDDQTPIYPPGTVAVGARYYLPILRPMKHAEAQALARQAGAHVAALSNREESYWVTDNLSKAKAKKGIWLGGEKTGGMWTWSTKEPWSYGEWAPGSPQEDEDATALVYLPAKGWHNIDKKTEADGVLLEWSKDADAASESSVSLSTATPDLAGLITKCRALVVASLKDRDTKHAANVKAFVWDLDVWLRGLKPVEKVQWQETVEVLKNLTREGRVPSSDEVGEVLRGSDGGPPVMHANIVKVHTYSFTKQKDIDAEYEARNEKIRSSYVAKIKEMGGAAQKTGQMDLVRQMKEYLEDAEDLGAWVSSMLED